jgi:hypothetical protein
MSTRRKIHDQRIPDRLDCPWPLDNGQRWRRIFRPAKPRSGNALSAIRSAWTPGIKLDRCSTGSRGVNAEASAGTAIPQPTATALSKGTRAVFVEYIGDPKSKIPGTKKLFSGIKDETEARNLWAYLRQFGIDGKSK